LKENKDTGKAAVTVERVSTQEVSVPSFLYQISLNLLRVTPQSSEVLVYTGFEQVKEFDCVLIYDEATQVRIPTWPCVDRCILSLSYPL
jgi:hypothetical protein